VSRILVMVMLAVGLVLAGCAPPEETGGKVQGEQGSEKAAKDERPTKERPKQERPGPEPDKKKAKPEKLEAQKPDNKPAAKPKQPLEGTSPVEETFKETVRASGASFVAHPQASGGSGHQANTILAVWYGMHEGYERLVLDFGTGEQTAETVPEWTLVRPIDDLILRVTLPSIRDTATSDGRFSDSLLKSFYVVRERKRGMFVDIIARQAFVYRVLELSNPARLVVDFKPGAAPSKASPPAVGGNTVLVEPRAGARIENPLTISGYSRNFEASNEVVLADSDGEMLIRRTVRSSDWTSTWGSFTATLDLPSYDGKATLRVGARSARDGTFEGAEIPVHVRR
jgi:hypothetical protein